MTPYGKRRAEQKRAGFGPVAEHSPQPLGLTLEVNGVRRQNGSTATMIFDVWHIVHYPAMLP